MESNQQRSLIADYIGFIGRFRLPRVDAGALLESRRKDIEALADAHATALTGMQTLARQQMDIVNARFTRLQSLVARKTDAPEKKPASGEAVQDAARKPLSDVQGLVEMAYRAQVDTLAVVSKRVAENIDEWKALIRPAK